jgi:hypothetical protein
MIVSGLAVTCCAALQGYEEARNLQWFACVIIVPRRSMYQIARRSKSLTSALHENRGSQGSSNCNQPTMIETDPSHHLGDSWGSHEPIRNPGRTSPSAKFRCYAAHAVHSSWCYCTTCPIRSVSPSQVDYSARSYGARHIAKICWSTLGLR